MSILIKGMKMPSIDLEWRIIRGQDGKWYAIDVNAETSDGEWHEIVPVPPHGDLIDRREAIIDVNERAYDFWLSDDEVDATIQFLKEQPTIIPASGGKENE